MKTTAAFGLLALLGWPGLLPAGAPSRAASTAGAPPAVLRVVGDNTYPPYLYLDADGRMQGYEADMWRLFQKHTGIRVKLMAMSWSDAQRAVLSGRADVIDTIYRTPAREALYDFTPAYARLRINIYVDDRIRGVHDVATLRGLPIGVERGDACIDELHRHGLDELRYYPRYRDIIHAAVKGTLRVFCMDENPAENYLYRASALDRFHRAFTLYTGQFHRAVRKGNTVMLQTLESGMAQVTAAERDALRARWLQHPLFLKPYLQRAEIALAVVAAVVLMMLLWVWMLRRNVRARTRELYAERNKLRAWFNASPDAMWVKDPQGVYQECNDRVAALLQCDRARVVGRTDQDLLSAEQARKASLMDARAMHDDQALSYEMTLAEHGREARQLEVISVPLRHVDHSMAGVLGVARDVTERRHAEGELRLAATAFRIQEALVVTDGDRIIQRVNQAFALLTGYPANELTGRPMSLIRSGHHDDAFHDQAWRQAEEEGFWQGDLWIKVRQGPDKVLRTTASVVHESDGRVSHFVLSMVDLTREREAFASLDRLTFFDPLTGLPNRRYMHDRLHDFLQTPRAGRAALLMIDLDHFKRVNDLRGHATGDHLLVMLVQRLRGLARWGHFLSRFSGATLTLLAQASDTDATAEAVARDCAEHVRAALAAPFTFDGQAPVSMTVSIGWTALVPGAGTADSVLKEAELAMYAAKAGGRDCVHPFESSMAEALERREALVDDLRQAIEGAQLEIWLQPQVDRAGHIAGAEALLRWTRADGARVPPGVFIPVAEETGLIHALGRQVLEQACRQLSEWADDPRLGRLSLAVNVSAHQFAQADFADTVHQIVAAHAVPPERLKLEITESVFLHDLTTAASKIEQLRAGNIRVALDDFGTFYSSLTYLSRLPLDQIKIDQSFIRSLETQGSDAMVVQSIIGLGHGLGLEVIAEGVETDAQRRFLLQHGCDAFQGYWFARPMPLADFRSLVATCMHLP